MPQGIQESKQSLREQIQKQRDQMSRDARAAGSTAICQQLWEIILQQKIKVIHSYLPMGSEVNLLPLLQRALDAGIKVVTPRTLKKRQLENLVLSDLKNLEPGVFGTYHPKNAEKYEGPYDLIVVPGLAFTQHGDRLGYGGGYYDTFLATQATALKIGVCYPFQLMESVPVSAHDIRLNAIVCGI